MVKGADGRRRMRLFTGSVVALLLTAGAALLLMQGVHTSTSGARQDAPPSGGSSGEASSGQFPTEAKLTPFEVRPDGSTAAVPGRIPSEDGPGVSGSVRPGESVLDPETKAAVTRALSLVENGPELEDRLAGIAMLAAIREPEICARLLDIAESQVDVQVREAAILGVASPEAHSLLPRLRIIAEKSTEPAVRNAAHIAVARVISHEVVDGNAFRIRVSFSLVDRASRAVSARFSVVPAGPCGPTALFAHVTTNGSMVTDIERIVQDADAEHPLEGEYIMKVVEDSTAVIEATASAKFPTRGYKATETSWMVSLTEDGVIAEEIKR